MKDKAGENETTLPTRLPVDSEHVRASRTSLKSQWLSWARVAWVLWAVVIISTFFMRLSWQHAILESVCPEVACVEDFGRITPERLEALQRVGLSAWDYATLRTLISVTVAVIASGIATLVFWRRSDDWMALLVALVLVQMGLVFDTGIEELAGAWRGLAYLFSFLGSALFVVVFFVFPDGRFVPGWTRWIALVYVTTEFGYQFFPGTPLSVEWWSPVLETVVWFGSWMGVAVAQLYRYRRASTPRQRQQTKWVVFGLGTTMFGILAFVLPMALSPSLDESLYAIVASVGIQLLFLAIPVSLSIAILRYRLYDIDVIIRRTLVYGVLTGSLILLYFGVVIVLEGILRTVTGGGSSLAVVLSTLTIVALSNPLRARIQGFIDKRLYRTRYDAETTLAAFGARLRERDNANLDRLGGELVSVIQETVQPAHLSLWLAPASDTARHASGSAT